jgi:hypothetical protein
MKFVVIRKEKPRMNINLHIEQIVLEGIDVSRRERPQLQATIQSELTRLLATEGFTHANLAQAHLVAEPIQLPWPNQPAQLGQQIATAVYGGMKQ